MPRKPFESGNKLGGRPKGIPNKVSYDIKQMVINALNKAGGENYLLQQARENPKAFIGLVGKIFPSTIIDNSTNNTLQLNISDVVKKALADSDRMYKGLQALKAGAQPLMIDAQPIDKPVQTHDMPHTQAHDEAQYAYVDSVTLKGEM